jgi:hypothetical protein
MSSFDGSGKRGKSVWRFVVQRPALMPIEVSLTHSVHDLLIRQRLQL